jgi:hypothetical protein
MRALPQALLWPLVALSLCACRHGGPQNVFFVGQANDGAMTAGGMMTTGWVERTPANPEDLEVDHYFVHDGDGAWVTAFGFVSAGDGKKPTVQALGLVLEQLAYRATRFDGRPTPAQISLHVTKGPTGLTKAAEPAAEAEFDVDGPPQMHVYAALVQLGRRYVFIVSGSSRGGPAIAEARDLARRIRF